MELTGSQHGDAAVLFPNPGGGSWECFLAGVQLWFIWDCRWCLCGGAASGLHPCMHTLPEVTLHLALLCEFTLTAEQESQREVFSPFRLALLMVLFMSTALLVSNAVLSINIPIF